MPGTGRFLYAQVADVAAAGCIGNKVSSFHCHCRFHCRDLGTPPVRGPATCVLSKASDAAPDGAHGNAPPPDRPTLGMQTLGAGRDRRLAGFYIKKSFSVQHARHVRVGRAPTPQSGGKYPLVLILGKVLFPPLWGTDPGGPAKGADPRPLLSSFWRENQIQVLKCLRPLSPTLPTKWRKISPF